MSKQDNNNAPFHVGQRVVCVKTHSRGLVKMGDNYKIIAIRKSPRRCPGWEVFVGVEKKIDNAEGCLILEWCEDCGHVAPTNYNPDWCFFSTTLFAPIEPRHQDVKIAEEIKEMAQEFATGTPEVSDRPKKEPAVAN